MRANRQAQYNRLGFWLIWPTVHSIFFICCLNESPSVRQPTCTSPTGRQKNIKNTFNLNLINYRCQYAASQNCSKIYQAPPHSAHEIFTKIPWLPETRFPIIWPNPSNPIFSWDHNRCHSMGLGIPCPLNLVS